MLPIGSPVTWTYLVTNDRRRPSRSTSSASTDDGGIAGSIAFLPMSVDTPTAYNDGDLNHNNLLDPR